MKSIDRRLVSLLQRKAKKLRREVIAMLYQAQSGHPGSALSTMDLIAALYFSGVLKYNPKQAASVSRDYFLLSNGHAAPALYAVLAEAGYFSKKELKNLRQLGSGTQGHPHKGALPGVEISSGSLGQGLSVGIGIALALKKKRKKNNVWVMMSDGEHQEGSTWEAIMSASKFGLSNLVAIVDKNGMQIDGNTSVVMPGLDPLADKYRAFNWNVLEIDGHDVLQILNALKGAKEAKEPTVIIAQTIRGRGVSFMENSPHWHAGALTDAQYKQALEDLK